MKKKTVESIEKLRKLTIDFLTIANSIPNEEWIELVKYIRVEKVRLQKIQFGAELGNIFLLLFYISEILDSVIATERTKKKKD